MNLEKKIIIFDDDEDILMICRYILEAEGWQVETSEDAIDVVEKVTAFQPTIILMDNWIPDEGGIVATQKLKQVDTLKHIPVVYFSANNEIKNLMEEAGADSFLSKPFEVDDLNRIIKDVLGADFGFSLQD